VVTALADTWTYAPNLTKAPQHRSANEIKSFCRGVIGVYTARKHALEYPFIVFAFIHRVCRGFLTHMSYVWDSVKLRGPYSPHLGDPHPPRFGGPHPVPEGNFSPSIHKPYPRWARDGQAHGRKGERAVLPGYEGLGHWMGGRPLSS